MKDITHSIICIVFGVIFGVLLLYFLPNENKGRYYDCSLSEISPDFPIQVKEIGRAHV